LLDSSPTGEIYRALDIDSQQAVAIKILHERYVVNRTVLHQMLDRFRAAVGLTHPHLVALYAAGEEDGRIFVASELEEDGSLRDLMELGPREAVPLYMGIDLIRQAA